MMRIGTSNVRSLLIALILVVIFSLVPFFGSGYIVRFLTFVFMWVILTQSLNIVTGYTAVSYTHLTLPTKA